MITVDALKESIFEIVGVIPAFVIKVDRRTLQREAVLTEPQFNVSALEALHEVHGGDFNPVNLDGRMGLRMRVR